MKMDQKIDDQEFEKKHKNYLLTDAEAKAMLRAPVCNKHRCHKPQKSTTKHQKCHNQKELKALQDKLVT